MPLDALRCTRTRGRQSAVPPDSRGSRPRARREREDIPSRAYSRPDDSVEEEGWGGGKRMRCSLRFPFAIMERSRIHRRLPNERLARSFLENKIATRTRSGRIFARSLSSPESRFRSKRSSLAGTRPIPRKSGIRLGREHGRVFGTMQFRERIIREKESERGISRD